MTFECKRNAEVMYRAQNLYYTLVRKFIIIIRISIIIIIIIIIIISFRVFVLILLRQTMSLGNTVLQLFCCYHSWCLVPVLNLLYFYISTFRSMCAVPNMAVFCSSLTSWFPGMLLTYFLSDFVIVPVAPTITGIITFVFTFHMRCISIVRSLYFRIFSASHLCLLRLQRLLTYMLPFHYHEL